MPLPRRSEVVALAAGRFSYRAVLETLKADCGGGLSDVIQDVLRLAYEGHRGQFRSVVNASHQIPYITHPVGTARIAIKHLPMVDLRDELDTVICVALLHDILEDSRLDSASIERVAGSKVRAYVEALTKPPADSAGRRRDERNREFLDRIIAAGPTCVFIKVCDSMHNLSRPAITPVHLFEKTVEKARGPYLSLLERCPLGNPFLEVYRNAIESATAKALVQQQGAAVRGPFGLEGALSQCVSASLAKVLETHDVAEIIHEVTDCDVVSIWRHNRSDNTLSLQVGIPSADQDVVRQAEQEYLDSSHELTGDLGNSLMPLDGAPFRSVYTIPMQVEASLHFVVALGFKEHGAPDWFSVSAATILVQFLAHRMIIAEADRRAELTREASKSGIQIDLDTASQLHVTPDELRALQRWRERCAQATSITEGAVREILARHFWNVASHELMRVTSRVKTINSILNKCSQSRRYQWPHFETMEDIAGVRVICPTKSNLQLIEDQLLRVRADAKVRLHSTLARPRRNYVSEESPSGYRAVHLVLEVATSLGEDDIVTVPCELQLRTLFQDTWATVSHATLYQAPRGERRRRSSDLRELARALDRCEEVAEKIFGDLRDKPGGV